MDSAVIVCVVVPRSAAIVNLYNNIEIPIRIYLYVIYFSRNGWYVFDRRRVCGEGEGKGTEKTTAPEG